MQSKQHDCIFTVVRLSQHAQLAATVVQYHNASLSRQQAQQHRSTESCRSLQQLCLKITPNLDATCPRWHAQSVMQLVQGACAAHTVAPTTSGFVSWPATTGPPAVLCYRGALGACACGATAQGLLVHLSYTPAYADLHTIADGTTQVPRARQWSGQDTL